MTFTKSQLELFMEFIGHRIPLNEQPKHVLFTKEELDMLSMNAYYGPTGIIKCRDKDTFYIEENIRKLETRIEKLEKAAPSQEPCAHEWSGTLKTDPSTVCTKCGESKIKEEKCE